MLSLSSMAMEAKAALMGVVAAIICLNAATATGDPKPYGYVAEIDGTWFANGKLLAQWDPIPDGAEIRFDTRDQFGRLKILRHGQSSFFLIDCASVAACARPINVTKANAQMEFGTKERFSAAQQAIIEAVTEQFQQHSKRYSHHIARGDELTDAVVLLRGGSVEPNPVFRGVARGRYLLRFRAVGSDAKTEPSHLDPITYLWDPVNPASLPVPPLDSPLQELVVLQKRGAALHPTGQSAWVLFCSPNAHSATERAFNEAVSLTRQWGDEVEPSARTAFLRGYLGHLAPSCR